MEEDWDLYAVVRSCKTTATAAASSSSMELSGKTTTSSEGGGGGGSGNGLSSLASLTIQDDRHENDPFSFPKLGEPRNNAFQELQQFFYKPPCFFPNPTTMATTSSHDFIIPNSSISNIGGTSSGQYQVLLPQQQQQQQQPYHHHLNRVVVPYHEQQSQHLLAQNGVAGPAQFPPQVQQQQQVLHQGFHAPDHGTLQMPLPNLSPSSQTQNPRSRKRKNQLKKEVRQVTYENVNSDLWAWRKYGQKPIKGSPYPRNYYRCSSSKGCGARKQVERSNVDPEMFIVTYTGEHVHPRPSHRNSLAGSTRAKTNTTPTITAAAAAAVAESADPAVAAAAAANSSSSPQSGGSLSPTTPLSETAAKPEEEEVGNGGEEYLVDCDREEYDDENILIPNHNVMGYSDEFFNDAFRQLGYSPPGAAC